MAVVEGDTDRPVAHKLAQDAGFDLSAKDVIDSGGKSQLDLRVHGYNRAARGSPWFVLRDLDSDERCAGRVVADLIGRPARWMSFRLAIREVESWLLADQEAIAEFLGIDPRQVPTDPDAEANPKQALVDLARRSPSASLRQGMVPRPGEARSVGPLYAFNVIQFGTSTWDVGRAAQRSDSLRRARVALKKLARRWKAYAGDRG